VYNRFDQCRIKVGAIGAAAAALWPVQEIGLHGHGREQENSSLYFGKSVVISLVGTISGKSLKLLPPDVIF